MNNFHYTLFGVSVAPPCADQDGFLMYRKGYENLPVLEWTVAEVWIAEMLERIEFCGPGE